MYEIIDTKYEENGFYRIRVKINENETMFLKFDHMPTIEEIQVILDRLFSPKDAIDYE